MISSIRSLNREYKNYFMDHQDRVVSDLKRLEQYLVDHQCTFKGVSMPTLLKPNFISRKQAELLRRSVELMSRALRKFIRLYLEDRRVREIMGFSDREQELFRIEPGYSNPLVVSRLDAFLMGDTLTYLEFNCDSPAGIAYADVMEEGFRELFREYPFLSPYRIEYFYRQEKLLTSLLGCYGEFRSHHRHMPENPVIAIVDWADVSTSSEFEMHRNHFISRGIDTIISTPQDFSIRNGKAFTRGQEVHLVYKRVITRELLLHWDDVGTFLEAVRSGLVCCCNSFRSSIVGNKKVLAVISDPRFRAFFDRRENELIGKTVPWTRILSPGNENYHGVEVNLKTFIPEHRESLVLKPCNKYGGKDVYLGCETSPSKWEEIMRQHLDDHMWVVQDYVDIPTGEFPEVDNTVRFKDKYVNINPYALNGTYSGTITRVSDNQVINVSAGGGLVPTLTAFPKSAEADI